MPFAWRLAAAVPLLGLLLAWPSLSTVSGQTLGSEFQVNTYTTNSQIRPSVAMDAAGNFVVAWASYDQDGSDSGVFAQLFDAAGVPRGAEFRVNTYTTGRQSFPSVAMDASGNFMVTWDGYDQDGSGVGVFAQRFNAAAARLGGEFRVNTFTPYAQRLASAALAPSGSFVVAWGSSGSQDGSGYGVFAQRFDAAGLPLGAEFQVNTYTPNNQERPSLAMDPNGNFVVAWHQYGTNGIFAQRFDGAGVRLGAEFRVNTDTAGQQGSPAVAMDASGNFVVAWHDTTDAGSPGADSSVSAGLFDASGVPRGMEFQVNSYTTGFQWFPSAAMDASGNFVIVWSSEQDEGGTFAQRFNAAGGRVGPEFQANTYTTGSQSWSSLAMDPSGNFVVAWESQLQDGSAAGVFARRFERAPSLAIGDVALAEGNAGLTAATFSVTLLPASDQTVTVVHATASGTATAGSDFISSSGTLTFDPGVTTRTIDVLVVGDSLDEPTAGGPSESFSVILAAATNAVLSDSQGQGTILNDDAAAGPPALDPVPGGAVTVGGVTTLTGANFTAGTRIKLFVNAGGSIDDVSGSDGFTPSAFTFNSLTWDVLPTIPLGQGFASVFVVNTDQGFATSNVQPALLFGDPADNIPTIAAIGGRSLASTLDPGIPVAHADTVVASGLTVAIAGTGFNDPGVNLFAAPDVGADPAPTATPCPVANYGPFFPAGTSTSLQVNLPAVPAGPANFQAVNSPYAVEGRSNSVSAVLGARPGITSVSVSGNEVTVSGTGFSCLSVINLFNLQGAVVVNLGGLAGSSQRAIPLQFISAAELRFSVPAGAVAGPAFVEVLNPPFIPFSSSGDDPEGAFTIP
jgi:hypothetical protein